MQINRTQIAPIQKRQAQPNFKSTILVTSPTDFASYVLRSAFQADCVLDFEERALGNGKSLFGLKFPDGVKDIEKKWTDWLNEYRYDEVIHKILENPIGSLAELLDMKVNAYKLAKMCSPH